VLSPSSNLPQTATSLPSYYRKKKLGRQFQNYVLEKGSFDENAILNPYFPVLQNEYQAARDRNL
jgi:hypothetical protein